MDHRLFIANEWVAPASGASFETIDPAHSERTDFYAETMFANRQRKGITRREARALLGAPNYFAAMMVRIGDADAFVAGLTYH